MESGLHIVSKPYVCRRCNRAFARLEHLQRHDRSHTKEKPFRCPTCPKAFTRRDLLNRHVRLSHVSIADRTIPNASVEQSDASGPVRRSESVALSIEEGVFTADPSVLTGINDNSNTVTTTEYSFLVDLDESHFDHFSSTQTQDFSSFMDSVPNLVHPFSLTHQPWPVLFPELNSAPPISNTDHGDERASDSIIIPVAAATSASNPSATESSLSRYGSRLPSLAPDETREAVHPPLQNVTKQHRRDFSISAECRQAILDQLANFAGCITSEFVLPSRHTLSRLVGGYFYNFHDHYPFFHTPTLQLETLNSDLVLAIAALGARYTREPDIGVELYRVARAVAMERVNRRQSASSQASIGTQHDSATALWSQGTVPEHENSMEIVQTLLLLMAVASWYKHEPAAQDALSIRSILHSLVRECGILEWRKGQQDDWGGWTEMETRKRTLLVVYCFFNIHTILFDLPPMMLTSEIKVDLPCSEQEWKACSEAEWRQAVNEGGAAGQGFQETYSSLFAGNSDTQPGRKTFSALGGYALIHAIIQQIWLVRNGRMPIYAQDRNSLSTDEMHVFERALKRWTTLWERNTESSMDPLSPYGPLTFTSTALLRLAYIRVNMDLGPVRSLDSWNASVVARSLHQSPRARRGDQMTRAALHCAHALSIPIRLGINYVAQTQVIRWSNQHALCSLECAVLLAKWLEAITAPEVSLNSEELRVLEFTAQLVSEHEYKVGFDWILEQKQRLSGLVVRLWAKLYQSKSVWQTVNLIGESLNIYADLLEGKH